MKNCTICGMEGNIHSVAGVSCSKICRDLLDKYHRAYIKIRSAQAKVLGINKVESTEHHDFIFGNFKAPMSTIEHLKVENVDHPLNSEK